jgi:hypothetical protein
LMWNRNDGHHSLPELSRRRQDPCIFHLFSVLFAQSTWHSMQFNRSGMSFMCSRVSSIKSTVIWTCLHKEMSDMQCTRQPPCV